MSDHVRESEFEGRPELVKKRARSIFWGRIGVTMLAIYIVVSLGVIVTNSVVSFSTRHTILDCTNTTGKCYKHGQKSTGELVRNLIEENHFGDLGTRRIVKFSAICSSVPNLAGNEHKINQCIHRMLTDRK
jgi:hypothetical protein